MRRAPVHDRHGLREPDTLLLARPDLRAVPAVEPVPRDRAHLQRMLQLLDAGAVSPPAITRYRLADAAEAHRVSEERHLQGKLVFEIR